MEYSIGELSKLFSLNASTLRYYEQIGLLTSVERRDNGLRIYKDADYETLTLIACLKDMGMSLNDIREYIALKREGETTVEARHEIFANHRLELLRKKAEIEMQLTKVDHCVKGLE